MSKLTKPKFDLSAGILCLDFANTVSRRKQPASQRDDLPGYRQLVSFVTDTGAISSASAPELLDVAARKPKARATVFASAIALREAIYRVFSARANSKAPNSKDIRVIGDHATQAAQHRQLAAKGGKYRWEWKRETIDNNEILASVLWPIAQSAADLLTSERSQNVRECEAQTCAWLFLDESRNHSRRWCDMNACGNRQKAKRHYERRQR